jgi:hypothetical protein
MCRYKSEGDPKGRSDCDSLREQNRLVHEMNENLREEIRKLREERRWVPVLVEIVDMEFSSEIGVYYGTIRCPKCNWEGQVTPRPKCRCGVQWDFSVSAVGEKPLPPGPEAPNG